MFSKTAEYALRATIYIAQKSNEGNKLSIDDIAKSIDAPRSFTAKILQLLTKGNKIISSTTGPNGGFYILDIARKYTVKAVLGLIKEDELLTKCVLGLNECSEIKPCPLHFEYSPIKKQLLHLFETKTIQELADQLKKEHIALNNRKALKKK
jgi:Rrf2 family transcriptional regulator, iron-sulfur cluster assembly transcription factor